MSDHPNIRKRTRTGKVSDQKAVAPTALDAEMAVKGEGPVGYKNPPKHTQFKKGQSGNPNGRPKRSKNRKTLIEEALERKMSVRLPNGQQKTMPAFLVIFEQQIQKAMKGDSKAATFVLDRAGVARPSKTAIEPEDLLDFVPEEVTAAELEALADYQLRRLLERGYSEDDAHRILNDLDATSVSGASPDNANREN